MAIDVQQLAAQAVAPPTPSTRMWSLCMSCQGHMLPLHACSFAKTDPKAVHLLRPGLQGFIDVEELLGELAPGKTS